MVSGLIKRSEMLFIYSNYLERPDKGIFKLIKSSFKLIYSSDKRELLETAKANALKILGVEKLDLPKSVKPILSEQSEEPKRVSPEPETRVRQDPEKTLSQVGV